jgi:putative membrane protein
VSQAKAGSYGAGLAPFFMSLAAWIGGYVLFLLVRPLSRRAMAANQTPLRVALGGWITPALVGVAQMAALLAVVGLAVRIVPQNLPGTLLFLVLMSATFVAIVHALNAWLGAAGQFLGLVLMVLQLVTAGGTFPWQTIPQPLHWLHHVLPMGYAVDGLRQLMYGGLSTLVVRDVLVLLAWLAVALLATSRAARAQRIWTVQRVKPELAI